MILAEVHGSFDESGTSPAVCNIWMKAKKLEKKNRRRSRSQEARDYCLAINGSPQKSGLYSRLLKRVLDGSREYSARARLIHLIDHEDTLFRLSHIKTPPKRIRTLLDQIRAEADCLVLATPVHWFGMSTLMKCFIDHLSYLEYDKPGSNRFELEGKVVSFVATADEDGGLKTVLDMVGPLSHMGAIIPPYATYFHNRQMAKKSEGEWMNDPEFVGRVTVQVAEAIKDISAWGRSRTRSRR